MRMCTKINMYQMALYVFTVCSCILVKIQNQPQLLMNTKVRKVIHLNIGLLYIVLNNTNDCVIAFINQEKAVK